MTTKIFGNKKITIRTVCQADLRNAKKFQDFINSTVREDAKLSMNKEIDLKGEKAFLKGVLASVNNKTHAYLVAESNNEIVGTAGIQQERWRLNHVGRFGIVIREG